MTIPVWLTLGVAALVLVFGVYRIHLALTRTPDEDAKAKARGGLYAMARRTHLLIGVVYLLLGAGLVATSFGWNPFGSSIGPDTEKPAADKAPSKRGIPIDQLPKKP